MTKKLMTQYSYVRQTKDNQAKINQPVVAANIINADTETAPLHRITKPAVGVGRVAMRALVSGLLCLFVGATLIGRNLDATPSKASPSLSPSASTSRSSSPSVSPSSSPTPVSSSSLAALPSPSPAGSTNSVVRPAASRATTATMAPNKPLPVSAEAEVAPKQVASSTLLAHSYTPPKPIEPSLWQRVWDFVSRLMPLRPTPVHLVFYKSVGETKIPFTTRNGVNFGAHFSDENPNSYVHTQIVIQNDKDYPVIFKSASVSGSSFSLLQTVPTNVVIRPKQSRDTDPNDGSYGELAFGLQFMPVGLGGQTGYLTVVCETYQASQSRRVTSTYVFPLKGHGITPPIMALDFDLSTVIEIGSQSSQVVTFTNDISEGGTLVVGADLVGENTLSFSTSWNVPVVDSTVRILPRQSASLTITYAGTENVDGVLRLTTNDSSSPYFPLTNVALRGKAAQGARMIVSDAEVEDLGVSSLPFVIPHNEYADTKFSYIGKVRAGGDIIGKRYRLKNANGHMLTIESMTVTGASRMSVHVIEKALASKPIEEITQTITTARPLALSQRTLNLGAYNIPVGGSLDVVVLMSVPTLEEARAEQFKGSMQKGQLEIRSNDTEHPVFKFSVAAAIGAEKPLQCSGDNDNWVADDFTCGGKANGTLCGSYDESGAHSRICNQGACVLMGDLDGDRRVTLKDLAAYLGDLDGNGQVDELDAQLKTDRFAGKWEQAGDFTCDNSFNQSSVEHFNRLANLIADFDDFESYNSRVVEMCTKRDLIANLAAMKANPTTPNKYPDKGLGYVFRDGYIDFEAMKAAHGPITATTPLIYKKPELVCLDAIGNYDLETGEEIVWTTPEFGSPIYRNDGKLTGRYLSTDVASFLIGEAQLGLFQKYTNDFRVNFLGETPYEGAPEGLPPEDVAPRREAILWASQVQMYYDITRYRNVFFNKHFTKALKLPVETEKNLLYRQHRPDLVDATVFNKPRAAIAETFFAATALKPNVVDLDEKRNEISTSVRTRFLTEDFDLTEVLNPAFDSSAAAADFPGLLANWVIADPQGFSTAAGLDNLGWLNTALPSVNNALSAWEAYRMRDNHLISKDTDHLLSRWVADSGCKRGELSCEEEMSLRNVMMYGGAQQNSAIYPFYDRQYLSTRNDYRGLSGWNLASFFMGALLYDLSNSGGLGSYATSLIVWKTLQYADDKDNYPMNRFASDLLRAARELFPSDISQGVSKYESAIKEVLTSRGLDTEGQIFPANLPSAVLDTSNNIFATQHPFMQVQELGASNIQRGSFLGEPASHYAFQFYRYSNLGPCDSFEITDGSYNEAGEYLPSGQANGFRKIFEGRELQNLILILPGFSFNWKAVAKRCDNDLAPDYKADVAPFGFRVVKAVKDGFGLSVDIKNDQWAVFNIIDEASSGQPGGFQIVLEGESGSIITEQSSLIVSVSEMKGKRLSFKRFFGGLSDSFDFNSIGLHEGLPRTIDCRNDDTCRD